ncbi:MAG TPA: molybdopterin-dependent oxidoreductase [Acidimicrobiales bacterium]|nr:molybdopterin-dependent oxidoreductase [Acidimicrobiales bacterium]
MATGPLLPPGPEAADGRAGPAPVGRRVFLGMVGLGALGVVVGSTAQRLVGDALRPVTSVGGGGLSALVPGADRFRIYTVTGGIPTVPDSQYRLTVSGLVHQPITLTLDELRALPSTSLVRDFQCVTGWRVPGVHWAGVRLSTLLDAAGLAPGATALQFDCFDGAYTESLTLAQARRPDVLVAYEFEGKPLTAEHGGPVRLYVAPMYGYKSAKWLSGIRVTDQVIPGYWEQEGYDVDAWVGHSNGRSDVPTS